MRKTILALISGCLALGATAAEISGNVTIATDYSFRGWSQTTRDPAIQGGFDVAAESGFYVGTWMSNVNFGDDTSTELDLYVGYGGEFGDSGVSYDVSYIRFEYISEGDALDYNELAASIGVNAFTFGINYSDAYLGDGGPTFYYPYAGYSWSVTENAVIDFHVGFNNADEINGDDDMYIDYGVTLTFPVAGADIGIGLIGTDLDEDVCDADCEARVILSISKSL